MFAMRKMLAAVAVAFAVAMAFNIGGTRDIVAQGFQLSGLPNGSATNPTISGQTAQTGIFFGSTAVGISRHLAFSAAQVANVPALSSCGTAPSLQAGSNDVAGKFTTGSAATTCTLTFGTARTVNIPSCRLTPEGSATQPTYTVSLTAIVASVDIASTVYNYDCWSLGS